MACCGQAEIKYPRRPVSIYWKLNISIHSNSFVCCFFVPTINALQVSERDILLVFHSHLWIWWKRSGSWVWMSSVHFCEPRSARWTRRKTRSKAETAGPDFCDTSALFMSFDNFMVQPGFSQNWAGGITGHDAGRLRLKISTTAWYIYLELNAATHSNSFFCCFF